MNIAIISPWAISENAVGGTERFTIDLATQLKKCGNHVSVFTLSGTNKVINDVGFKSLDILGDGKEANEFDLQRFAATNNNESFYSTWAKFLDAKIDVSQFDVVQLNSLLFVDALKSAPRLFTIHTNPFEYQLDWGRSKFDHAIRRVQDDLPRQTLLAAPSQYYAMSFSKLFQREVLAIPHAIDRKRLKNINKSFNKKKVTILLPSRIELEQKRPQVVFQGISLLPPSVRKNIKVIASGKDSQYQDNCKLLQEIAERSGFEAHFTKFDSMDDAYAAADIVALPSKSESFGYAALESLSLGIPTILNMLPTFKEIGADNPNAYFFEETLEAFAETLSRVLQNLQTSPNKQTWLDRYDIERWGQTYQDLLNRAMAL